MPLRGKKTFNILQIKLYWACMQCVTNEKQITFNFTYQCKMCLFGDHSNIFSKFLCHYVYTLFTFVLKNINI